MQGRNVLERFSEFYVLLPMSFSLTITHTQQRGARGHACTFTAANTEP